MLWLLALIFYTNKYILNRFLFRSVFYCILIDQYLLSLAIHICLLLGACMTAAAACSCSLSLSTRRSTIIIITDTVLKYKFIAAIINWLTNWYIEFVIVI